MEQVLARTNVRKTKFKAAEMIVDPWKQQQIRQQTVILVSKGQMTLKQYFLN